MADKYIDPLTDYADKTGARKISIVIADADFYALVEETFDYPADSLNARTQATIRVNGIHVTKASAAL